MRNFANFVSIFVSISRRDVLPDIVCRRTVLTYIMTQKQPFILNAKRISFTSSQDPDRKEFKVIHVEFDYLPTLDLDPHLPGGGTSVGERSRSQMGTSSKCAFKIFWYQIALASKTGRFKKNTERFWKSGFRSILVRQIFVKSVLNFSIVANFRKTGFRVFLKSVLQQYLFLSYKSSYRQCGKCKV